MVESKAPEAAKKVKPRAKKAKKNKHLAAGRPELEVSAEQRDRVEILVGGGMAIEDIAAALSMSEKTLRKHFRVELKRGRSKKRAEMLEAMFRAGNGGNVSAQKAYMALNEIATADDNWVNPQAETTAPKPAKLGKKELAAEAAGTAGVGTEWKNDLETPPLPSELPN